VNVRDGVAQRTRDNNDVVTAVGLSNVPEAIRSAASLARPDYVDCFTAAAVGDTGTSAVEWARALLEDTPTGRSAPALWRLLGLRLGPTPSTDNVQGWKIADRTDDWIRVEATSRVMPAHAVVRVDDGAASYDRRIAALIWPPGVRDASPSGTGHAPSSTEETRFPTQRHRPKGPTHVE
jgi:hypothetical protein